MSVSARLALPKPLMRWWAEDARRDLRIDMLRGLFVVAMVADHTASGTVLNRITGGGHRMSRRRRAPVGVARAGPTGIGTR